MNDLKLAILQSFENTVKALLNDNSTHHVECVYDSSRETNELHTQNMEVIMDHLQGIRQEFTEVRMRLQRLEEKIQEKDTPWNGLKWQYGNSHPIPKNEIIDLFDDRPSVEQSMKTVKCIQKSILEKPIDLSFKSDEPDIEEQVLETDSSLPDVDEYEVEEEEEEEEEQENIKVIVTKQDTTSKKSVLAEKVIIEEPKKVIEKVKVEEIVKEKVVEKAVEKEEVEVEVEEEEQEVEEEEQEAAEEVEEEEQEADEEEQEAEEEELVDFTFNNVTYYRDSQNLVYSVNDEGELNEDPVGRWIEVSNIVRFFAKK